MNTRVRLEHGDAILSRLPEGQPLRGAEVGVAAGALSGYLLAQRPQLTLLMVDAWRYAPPDDPYHAHCQFVGDPNGVRTSDQVTADYHAATAVAYQFRLRTNTFIAASDKAAGHVPDREMDFVFIDADHSEAATLADCRAWRPKVKPGGWIGGHDIDRFRDGGVRRAVDRFAAETGLTIETDRNWTWFARIPVAGGEA